MSDDGTTKLYNAITMTVQGVCNYLLTTMDNAEYIRLLRTQLGEPRGALTVQLDGNATYLHNSTGIDAKNGPIPLRVEVIAPTIGTTIIVAITIQTFVSECDYTGSQPDAVILNRWSQSHEVNAEGYSTLRSAGQLIVRTDGTDIAGNSPPNPDLYRNQIWPVATCPLGMTRDVEEFSLASDGTTQNWTVVDSEKYRPGTNGITRWEGSWREGQETDAPGMMECTFDATATAPKTVSKDTISQWLAQVALSRMTFGGNCWLRSFDITELLHHNQMNLRITVNIVPGNKALAANLPSTLRVGLPINVIDGNLANTTFIGTRGSYYANLLVNELASTCSNKIVYIYPPNESANTLPSTRNTGTTPTTGSSASTGGTNYTSGQLSNPYTKWQIEKRLHTTQNILQLPCGDTSGSGNASFPQFAAPTTTLKVRYWFERIGAQPVIPQAITNGNVVLLDRVLDLPAPLISPDGETKFYTVRGEDVYGFIDATDIGTDAVTMPVSPMDANTGDSNLTVSASSFVGGLVS